MFQKSAFALFATLVCLTTPAFAADTAPSPILNPMDEVTPQPPQTQLQKLVVMINEERARHHLSPLQENPFLTSMSQWRTDDMAKTDKLEMVDSLGRNMKERMKAFGYKYVSHMGEMIALGGGKAEPIFKMWMNSAQSREILLNPNYHDVGIGRTQKNDDDYPLWYWDINFGAQWDSESAQ